MLFSPKVSPRHAAVVLAAGGGLVAGMILAVPGVASAATVTCGETITSNTTLTANLNCTGYNSGPALTIGASGVTLNLGGHEILGPGDSAGTQGIYDYGYAYVTIENGSLSNFYYDLNIEGSGGPGLTGIVVQKIKTTDDTLASSTSVFGASLDGASITQVTSTDAAYGLYLLGSEDSAVSGNTVSYGYLALYDEAGGANTWSGNTVKDGQSCGLDAEATEDDVVEGNTFEGTLAAAGVCGQNNEDITITRNTFNDLYSGVQDFGDSAGTISGNRGTGDDWGVYTEESVDDTITGNTFSDGTYGIETDYPAGEVLRGNTVNDNGEAGVYVYTENGGGTYSATLTSNTGNDNRFGLYSQIPTTGSGNHASGNKVVNCYNVKCVKAKGGRSLAVAPPHYAPMPASPSCSRAAREVSCNCAC
jgi:parallel beta-helix repeat protein